jgi:virginiamycin B lyase
VRDGSRPGRTETSWFTERSGDQVGRLIPAGAITEFAVPTAASQPAGVAAGPDGEMWFAERSASKPSVAFTLRLS